MTLHETRLLDAILRSTREDERRAETVARSQARLARMAERRRQHAEAFGGAR